eukprot:NODE_8_length_47770_cov_0.334354.p16 type:complete len:190 gc:universal NODE_8_length_47770_cov_0.334354:35252-34683(-)
MEFLHTSALSPGFYFQKWLSSSEVILFEFEMFEFNSSDDLSEQCYNETDLNNLLKEIGTRLPSKEYKILELLGKGGFAQVRQGIHLKTNQTIACKQLIRNKQDNNRLCQEITILSAISTHSSVLPLLDVLFNNNEIWLIFPLAEKDLFDFIKHNGKLPEELAKYYFRTIVDIIGYCHSKNIVHRYNSLT